MWIGAAELECRSAEAIDSLSAPADISGARTQDGRLSRIEDTRRENIVPRSDELEQRRDRGGTVRGVIVVRHARGLELGVDEGVRDHRAGIVQEEALADVRADDVQSYCAREQRARVQEEEEVPGAR